MTDSFDPLVTRRTMLRHLVVAGGAAAGLSLLGWPAATRADTAEASGTASKAAVQYQGMPKGTSACANCANFITGKDPTATGRCTIVAGDISPKGWCLAYAGNG